MATEQSCFHTSLLFPGAQLIFIVQCKLVYKYFENCQLLMLLPVCSLITDQSKLLAALSWNNLQFYSGRWGDAPFKDPGEPVCSRYTT